MWTRPGSGATTSRCICGAPSATAARSNTRQLANLSTLPDAAIGAIEAVLKGRRLVPAGDAVRIDSIATARARRGGARRWRATLGLPALLGPACRARDLAYGADRVAGAPAGLEAVHADLVGRHHPRGRSGGRRRVHRRGLRRDGLAGRPPGRDRKDSWRHGIWAPG